MKRNRLCSAALLTLLLILAALLVSCGDAAQRQENGEPQQEEENGGGENMTAEIHAVENTDFFENGLDGILTAAENALGISFAETIYISDTAALSVREDGSIGTFDALLFRYDENNELRSFHILYDAQASQALTITEGEHVYVRFLDQQLFSPMQKLLRHLRRSDVMQRGTAYSLTYGSADNSAVTAPIYVLGTDGGLMLSEKQHLRLRSFILTVFEDEKAVAVVTTNVTPMLTVSRPAGLH